MPLLKPKSNVDKKEIKRGEEKLKSIIGGKLVHNAEFLRLLKANNISNTSKVWGKINQQIKLELANGSITYEDVEERINQLILLESPYDRLITLEEADADNIEDTKRNILAKGKISIQIPYQSSGVGDVVIGSAIWGRNGALLGALNEGQTKWNYAVLSFMNEGFTIKSTGEVILYEDIKSIVLGNKGFLHTIVTVILKNESKFICKVANVEVQAFKSIINDHITVAANNISEINDNADVLLKYADLFEKGLITREEFDEKKEQLLHGNGNAALPPKEEKTLFCFNCGKPVDSDSNFCTNCGCKIDYANGDI